ncbi:RHS repeat protein [Burkholderia dolosa]|uniref:RHS repeat-associated core domain-containing protein n=1 Tax=Burkholderia dolosa TaxID=152500 RepID=UPI001B9310DE|nr:RHS repeat-associated core domain-containing protein [Burkholderia dolosa]MBR8460156.1 RHS repeat protein [Burkholderia dolosa]MDN7420401.1 RHS repeat-associated core domain-containing protein [Burkholderia dolosa]
MSGIGGLGGVLAGLPGTVLESLDIAPRVDRHRQQPGDLARRYGVDRALSGLLCESVDMVSGSKICLPRNEVDFTLPGRLPMSWARFYSSALSVDGMLGTGWRTGWDAVLRRRDGDRIDYVDDQGRTVSLPMPERGSQIVVSSEQLHVARLADDRFVVADLTPHYTVFGEFDEHGVARIKYVEDLARRRIGCIWDGAGRLLRMRGTCRHELRMHYERDAVHLTGIECVDGGPTGFLVRYAYDEHGRLAEVRNRHGDIVRGFAYDADGRMIEEVGPLRQTTRYTWQTIGGAPRVVERSTCRGARERCTYELGERGTRATDVFGHTAHWQYDQHGRVLAYADFDGRRYAFQYDGAGWPTELTLPGDRQIRVVNDNLGRPTREETPLDGVRSTVYAFATREPLSIRLQDGRTWLWQRDEQLRPTQFQSPSDGITQIAYEERDGVQIRTDTHEQRGVVVLECDARGLVLKRTDAAGRTTVYRRDANGHVAAITDPFGAVTQFEPDLLGRPQVITLPDGRQERRVWNAAGQLITSIGVDGQARHWHRDQYGCVVRAVDEEGNVTAHEFDAHGRRIRTVAGNGGIQCLTWGPVDRLTSVVDADGVTRSFSYAASGDLQQITWTSDGHTRIETFATDALGRVVGRDTEHARYRYTYVRDSLLGMIQCLPTDAGAAIGVEPDTLRFEYDAAGRVTAEHGMHGTLRYAYDAAGRLVAVTLPDGHIVKTERDDVGTVALAGLAHGDDVRAIAAFHYELGTRQLLRSVGELYLRSVYAGSSLERWFAMTVTRTPDNEMLPGSAEFWREFRYSPAGHLVQVDDRFNGRTYYDYDRRGCLLRVVSDDIGLEHFTWDAAGNLLDTPSAGWQRTVYPDHRLREHRGYRYEYDSWGQVVAKRGAACEQTFTWDADGRLMSVRSRRCVVRYRYDALGRRVAKSVSQPTASGMLGPADRAEAVTRFVWQGERLVQETTGDNVRIYLYQPAREGAVGFAPLACVHRQRRDDGTFYATHVYHYQTDLAGTAVALTDEGGKLVWSGRYNAWGRVIPWTRLATPVWQPLRFAGQYLDDETGLHLNGRRYYDPDAGRYLSPDRSAPAGVSPYRYVSNPLSAANPTGRAVSLMRPTADVDGAICADGPIDLTTRLTGDVDDDDVVPGGEWLAYLDR